MERIEKLLIKGDNLFHSRLKWDTEFNDTHNEQKQQRQTFFEYISNLYLSTAGSLQGILEMIWNCNHQIFAGRERAPSELFC
jgi:hypothetical protein